MTGVRYEDPDDGRHGPGCAVSTSPASHLAHDLRHGPSRTGDVSLPREGCPEAERDAVRAYVRRVREGPKRY